MQKQSIFSQRFLILLGNILDHYDTALYGLLAPLFAKHFFPKTDPVVALILTYGLVSTSIITRPLGALLFSYIARKLQPQQSMAFTLMGIGVTTGCLGLLPTYNHWGYLAPICIALIRFCQGLFASGENTMVPIYLLHQYPKTKHGWANSLYQSTTIIGILCASAFATVVTWIPDDEAWRWPFLLGSLTAFVGVIFRFKVFKNVAYSYQERPVIRNLIKYRSTLLGVVLLAGLGYIPYAVPFVFMNAFIPFITDISYSQMLAINTNLLIFDLALLVIAGRFVDRIPFEKMMKIVVMIFLVSVIPLFIFLPGSSYIYVTFVRVWITILGVLLCVPMSGMLLRQIPEGSQFGIIGTGYAIGSEIFGRSTTALCLWLWHQTNSVMSPALYITFVVFLGFIGLKMVQKRKENHEL